MVVVVVVMVVLVVVMMVVMVVVMVVEAGLDHKYWLSANVTTPPLTFPSHSYHSKSVLTTCFNTKFIVFHSLHACVYQTVIPCWHTY